MKEMFDRDLRKYEEFTKAFLSLIIALIENSDVKTHTVTSRTKSLLSIAEKVERKAYNEPSQLTDVCGIRIITYFTEDVERIASLVEKEFHIDTKNSVDKRSTSDFGYSSLHYVCLLNESRLALGEYGKFAGMKCEVQIRTILQHAWAEIEHDLGYKGRVYLSHGEQKTFRRIAALLEQADMEFLNLKMAVSTSDSEVEITDQSIKDLIFQNDIIDRTDQRILETMRTKKIDLKLVDSPDLFSNQSQDHISSMLIDFDFRIFRFIGIRHKSELQRLLVLCEPDLLKTSTLIDETEFEVFGLTPQNRDGLPMGYSLGVLIVHMILHSSDLFVVVKDRLKDYYRQRLERTKWKVDIDNGFERVIDVLLDKYQRLPANERQKVT